ncbi:MAG: hypothetical protein V4539_03195 [Bacteroidota bacterium]
MNITLRDLLTTYWAQTVLAVAAVAYLIKRILDERSKKIAIKQELFQQKRNAIVMQFLDAYIELQKLYRQILNPSFDIQTITSKDYLLKVDEKFEELYAAYFRFRIFVDQMEQTRYSDLVTAMRNILVEINKTSKAMVTGDNETTVAGLQKYISERLKENNENLKVIGKLFRDNADKGYPLTL